MLLVYYHIVLGITWIYFYMLKSNVVGDLKCKRMDITLGVFKKCRMVYIYI